MRSSNAACQLTFLCILLFVIIHDLQLAFNVPNWHAVMNILVNSDLSLEGQSRYITYTSRLGNVCPSLEHA